MDRPKYRALALSAAALIALAGVAAAQKSGKPSRCVTLARSWEAAVEEAKLLNVPIVVHSHGFYCGPCWGMHGAVMENKKYIKFASQNCVDVVCVSQLEKGIQAGDRKAATYPDKGPDGQAVEYMLSWPGLTAEELLALGRSPAGRYNTTGKVPYTCLVDPHTLEEVKNWLGGTSAKSIMEAIKEARKALEKAHGKGVSRAAVEALAEAEAAIDPLLEKGEFARAAAGLRKAAGGGQPPEALAARLERSQQKIREAAAARLAAIRAASADDPATAARHAKELLRQVRGTDLEGEVQAFLKSLSG